MSREELSRRDFHRLASMLILGAVLAACTPEGQAQETKPAVTQTIDDLDSIPAVTSTAEILKTSTPENTPTMTATATPEHTATPEKSEAEKMHEYCIQRAKEVGIDLENLANSNNLWLTEHPNFASLQEALDNNFSEPDQIFKTMIVVGLDSLNSESRYNLAPTTAANKKIMTWLEAVYKKADGHYQMVLLPTNIWDIDQELMWSKQAIFGGPQYYSGVNNKHSFNNIISGLSSPNYNPDLDWGALFTGNLARQNYYIGPGAIISFDSDYPADETTGGSGTLEIPSFSEEQMLEFQNMGNVEFFPYSIKDSATGINRAFIYPFINYGVTTKLDQFQEQSFITEFVSWFRGDNSQWLNPDGPPYPRYWQALP